MDSSIELIEMQCFRCQHTFMEPPCEAHAVTILTNAADEPSNRTNDLLLGRFFYRLNSMTAELAIS